jgi:hypothetical protein
MSAESNAEVPSSQYVGNIDDALYDVLLLLDYLGRQNDAHLQAHFDSTRTQLLSSGPWNAVPPCKSYDGFLIRLARIQGAPPPASNSQSTPDEALHLDDLSFLRWSRDFLAAVTAPASIQSIRLTQEYIEARADIAISGRWYQIPAWIAAQVSRPIGREKHEEKNATGSHTQKLRPSNTALWLARSVLHLEARMLIVIFVTLVLSTYVMAGRFILDQEQKAYTDFMETTRKIEASKISLLEEADWSSVSNAILGENAAPCLHLPKAPATQVVMTVGGQEPGATSVPSDPPVLLARGHSATDIAIVLSATCRERQWNLMRMVSENVRLKSWDTAFITVPLLNLIIGWNDATVREVGSVMGDDFCRSVANAYGERYPVENADPKVKQGDCITIVRLLVQDSSSTASAILGCLTLYVLPCLYAYLGAAAATMFAFRRKVDLFQLNYTDRGRSSHNERLGLLFGAVVGLFSGRFGETNVTNGLALSALALLAGYNVPGVFAFLDDLSGRVFRPSDSPLPRSRSTS